MREHEVEVDHRPHIFFVEQLDLRNLVRGAEAVEEVQERNARFERGRLGDQRKVHRLLHRGG